ncbi:MAG: hypothetical protein M9953_12620 [Thermomicrobiales bacterium]|nr:hypothetical protein [Thermomicrobiales bacterium]MCO5217326.1 hypothetical protein [Thermomicrobiales bacterium]MCO5226174.1 hypothetical protein [Thermomicrobiales bacterium]MCO5228711.1 hypothetical protein [Thermomicrobiales bacterium]
MDDELEIQPWPVLELIGRAVALTSVARRGLMEVDEDDDVFTRETDRFELSTWVRTELTNWITDTELEIIQTPIGNLTEEQMLTADEALSAAGAVAWALRGVTDEYMPVPDTEEFNAAVLAWAPTPWDKVRNLQKRVRLRSDEDLAGERERMELWYWRSGLVTSEELDEVVAEINAADLMPTADGDLAVVGGIAYGMLSEEARDDIAWVAEQRLRALNWVCGFGDSWETAPLELD